MDKFCPNADWFERCFLLHTLRIGTLRAMTSNDFSEDENFQAGAKIDRVEISLFSPSPPFMTSHPSSSPEPLYAQRAATRSWPAPRVPGYEVGMELLSSD